MAYIELWLRGRLTSWEKIILRILRKDDVLSFLHCPSGRQGVKVLWKMKENRKAFWLFARTTTTQNGRSRPNALYPTATCVHELASMGFNCSVAAVRYWWQQIQYNVEPVHSALPIGRWTAGRQGHSPGGHGTTTCYSAATPSRGSRLASSAS